MNQKLKKMVTLALLIAIIIVLQTTASMLPKLPGGAALSFVLIPIVLGAAMYGVKAGAVLGAAFGLLAFWYSATNMDPVGFAIFQVSPIGCFAICVLKSTIAGSMAGLVYRLFTRINEYLAMLMASIVCPILNSGIFFASVAVFFKNTKFTPDGGVSYIAIMSIFGVILMCNSIPELILNIVFSPAGQRIVKTVKKN